MKYKKLVLVAYNSEPTGPLPFGDDCFHVELDLKDNNPNFTQLMREYITPAVNMVYARMIPDER